MKGIVFICRYFRYYFSSNTLHGTHSPFVYKLLEEVIYSKSNYYAYENIEALKKQILQEKNSFSLSPSFLNKYYFLLFRLINQFKPENILLAGTTDPLVIISVALPRPSAKVFVYPFKLSSEGIRMKFFKEYGLNHAELIDDSVLENSHFEFIFFNLQYRIQELRSLVKKVLTTVKPSSVFIFGGIQYSEEGRNFWEEIKKQPEVKVSIDLFQFGILFFREGQAVEKFNIYF